MIDSHVHVFRKPSARYPRVVAPLFPSDREAPIDEFLTVMEEHGITNAVLVPLSAHDEYVAECLRDYPEVFKAILVQDPAEPDSTGVIRRRLEDAGAHGVRLFDLGPQRSESGESFGLFDLFQWLEAGDLKLSVYLQPADFQRLEAILEVLPNLAVVLNHLALPNSVVDTDRLGRPVARCAVPPSTWPTVRELARFPNVHVMFSGQYGFSRDAYPYDDLVAYARMIYETYGAARMMWASDYPWPGREPGYRRLLDLVDLYFPDLSESEHADITGATCGRLFGIS